MAQRPLLAPIPRRVVRRPGRFRPQGRWIALPANANDELLRVARRLQALLRARLGLRVLARRGAPPDASLAVLDLDPARSMHPQGYRLRITSSRILIQARSAVGAAYAVATLAQLLAAPRRGLGCWDIDDAPDFARRGVMLDISRTRVPTMRTLRGLIDWLASLKVNQLQLYMEHTFAYRRHRGVWRGSSPLTGAEVRGLDAYCRARFVELVPNQNTLGHMERWLRRPRYAPLAEATGPFRTPFGDVRTEPTTLNPSDPRSLRLVGGLLDELLPNFSSRCVNVGCDEPFELGQGRSAAACRRRGRGRVYLDYLLALRRRVRRHGRRMMFWGDVVAEHPESVGRLPRDLIALEWGYEADHPFDARCAAYAAAGLEFYVCPGTSSWCSFAGRTANALANLRRAADAGRRQGAAGYLVTDWGDHGHRQVLPISFAPWVYGAALAWGVAANRRLHIVRAASAFAFGDWSGRAARPWLRLGGVSEMSGVRPRNGNLLFRVMQARFDDPAAVADLAPPAIRAMRRELAAIRADCWPDCFRTPDAAVVRAELSLTIDVLDHACRRAAAMLAMRQGRDVRRAARALAAGMRRIIAAHRRLWRRRNRPGGLAESAAYYERNLQEYLHCGWS